MSKGSSSILPTKWFRPFIEEPPEATDLDDDLKSKSSLPQAAIFLLVLSVLGLVVSMLEAVQFHLHTAYASTAIWLVAFLLLTTFRPRTGSFFLVALFLSSFVTYAVSIARSSTTSWSVVTAWDVVGAALAAIAVVVVLNMPFRHPSLSRKGISPVYSIPSNDTRSPEDNLTLWQWMSVSWMSPLMRIGNKRQLNDEDVWLLGFEFQHTHLHEAFRQLSGTVIRRLIKANWIDLFILTLLCIFELLSTYSSPLLLQQLLRAMENLQFQKRPAIAWALLILAQQLLATQSGAFSLWFGRRCYERSRGEMITMLHEKVLNRKNIGGIQPEHVKDVDAQSDEHVQQSNERDHTGVDNNDESQGLLGGNPKAEKGFLSRLMAQMRGLLPSAYKDELPNTKQPASMGKILNLMRNDVYEVSQRFWDCQEIINKPLGLIFSVVLAWRLLGWSCLVGVAVVVLAQIINAILARMLISWEKVRRQATDHKLQQISQYIEAIRHLRWYGWHMTMLDNVMSARQKELKLRLITWVFNMVILNVNVLASGLLPLAAFWAYTMLAGHQLRIDVVFPALQIFTLLRRSIQDLPGLITSLINAAIAVGRIEDFMSEPDVGQSNVTESENKLELQHACFSWPGVSQQVLQDITLSFQPGLNLIIGPVASGKSALLQALLGELDLKQGNLIKPDVSMAFCSQSPWLQSMSIRENILFGAPYEESRYKDTLEICALLPDLASFEHGDLSPIGENGIGLSGGQKARVALARAVYSRAHYLLLDDPLSALDQQTAEWIVAKCFRGKLLENRTTVLVTHRTDLCQGVSVQTIEMSKGTAVSRRDEVSETVEFHDLQRAESLPDQVRKDQESAAIPAKFEDEEHRTHGGIRFEVYWEYVKAGRLKWWLLVILTGLLWRVVDYMVAWFLKEWSEAYRTANQFLYTTLHQYQTNMPMPASSTPLSRFFDRFPDPNVDVKPWLLTFLILVLIQSAVFAVQELAMLVVMYTAGKNMFADIMKSISLATFRFYDVTPVGRLMNRITGDVATVDGPISQLISYLIWHASNWIMAVVVIATVTPSFLILSVTLSAVFVYIFTRYLPTSQSLRRLEMVSLSPLMSNFGALLHGLTTVRAFHAQPQFQSRVIAVTDAFQKMDHFYWSLQTWLMYRYDFISATSTFFITLLAIFSGLSPGLTAFVLITANRFVAATHALCKKYGTLQLDFVSVERVVELLSLEPEDPGTIIPPASWPSPSGDIVFEDVTLRYAAHLPPALKNISLTIRGGASAALIGRTGSGKSTLALALLATITPESGRILIDGIDIALVSKQILRSRITFLAQDPVLFPGTLRTNLDPLSQHSDAECAAVLARIGGDKYAWHLGTEIDTGGKNLSQGQRQLVGLARAILRRSSIVILDEATASIDYETSREVQRVLRDELGRGNSTVVGIAHRASAVEGCDVVVKLKHGELVSVGVPEGVHVEGEQNGDSNGTGDGVIEH